MFRQELQIIFFLTVFLLCSFEKTSEYNSVDNYVRILERKLKCKKLKQKSLKDMSKIGGAVTGYYLNEHLTIIKTTYSGESGYDSYSFYLKQDRLCFVKEIKKQMNGSEVKTNNKCNTKQFFSTNINNTYYLINDSIVKYSLRSFDRVIKPIDNEIIDVNRGIIYRYKTHLAELKQN